MPKVKISISLSFIGYLLLLVALGRGLFILTYMLVLFIHEYAHALVASSLGYKLNSIKLAPFGICLNIDSNIERVDSIKIAFAGPLVNFVLAIVCMAVWWVLPQAQIFTKDFFEANVLTGLFNLLPCYPLDGGRILKDMFDFKQPKKLFIFLNSLFAAIFFVMFLFAYANLSLVTISLFLLLSIFTFSGKQNYEYLIYINKKNQSLIKTKEYAVDENTFLFKLLTKITPNTYTTFLVVKDCFVVGKICEGELKTLLEKYSPTAKISEVLKT